LPVIESFVPPFPVGLNSIALPSSAAAKHSPVVGQDTEFSACPGSMAFAVVPLACGLNVNASPFASTAVHCVVDAHATAFS
jgi:hypothetical protein